MKKRFTLFIAMIVLLSTITTNVFASTLNSDSEIHKDKFNEYEYFDKEYNIGSFQKDLFELKPGLNSDEVKLYTQNYIICLKKCILRFLVKKSLKRQVLVY